MALGCCALAASSLGATFSYLGPTVGIPDGNDLSGTNPGAAVFAPLNVTGMTGVVSKVVFRFDGTISSTAGSTVVGLDHTFVNDLKVTLISPQGTNLLIINQTDGSGNNFAQLVLDDDATTNIQTATTSQAPFNGTWAPNAPLSIFNGENPNGTWQLMVQDFYSQDTGNIRLWSLDILSIVLNSGPLLQNSSPVGIPTEADFIVDGPVQTGSPTEDNTVNSLTFLPGSSLKIYNTLNVTTGPVNVVDTSSIDLQGTLATSQVNILSGGLLSGNGTINGHLYNAGLVSPGASPGTIYVTGDYAQGSTGALRIEVGGLGSGQYDLLAVTGRAQLDGGVQIVRLNDFNLKRGDRVVFLTAGQGVTGEFATVTSDFTSNTILQPLVVYSPTDVALEMVQGSFGDYASNAGLTQNQIATAKGLDSVAFGTTVPKIIDFLDEQPLQDLPAYFDKIAPEELASIFNIANSLSNIQMTNLERRLEDVRAGSTGFSGQRFALQGSLPDRQANMGFAGTAGPNGKEMKQSKVVTQPEATRWGFFANGAGEFVDIENTGNAKGFDFQSGGITLGVDYRVNDNFVAGLTVGYAHTGVDLTGDGSVGVDAGRIGLYATAFAKGFYLDAAVSGGYSAYDTRRQGVQGSAYGDSNASELDVYVGTGYDFKAGGLTFGPIVNFQYTYVDLDGFTEHGSLAPLKYDEQSNDSIRLTVGLKASYDWKLMGRTVRPSVRVAWQHEFGDTAPAVTAALGTGGSQFTVYGPNIGEDAVLVGAGFSVEISETASAFLYYDGEFGRSNYQLNAISGGVRLAF